MNTERNEWLYTQVLNGTATDEERAELLAWLALPDNEQKAKDWLLAVIADNDESQSLNEESTDSLLEAIYQSEGAAVIPIHTERPKRRRWIPYAAAILVIITAGFWWMNTTPPSTPVVTTGQQILPAKQGAILTLADGRQLVLDSLQNGQIAIQNGAHVSLQNGRLSYSASADTQTAFNTITTPRGRKYDIVLADGTHIWLNAASSVTYPAAFTGNERRVKITGEAYLEVAKDKQRPFIVDIDARATAQVVGTSFNIKAYAEEPGVETTLIEGALLMSGKVMRPNQQMQIDKQGDRKLISDIDPEPVLAWKNGIFNFKNADLQTVMRELSRWYDIQVVYDGALPTRRFQGEIGRDLTLQQVLKGLKHMNVHFEIRGNQIVVTR